MSAILPKYTAGEIIAAMMTLKTTAELDKFYGVINDNPHLGKQYKRMVRTAYNNKRPLVIAQEDFDREIKALSDAPATAEPTTPERVEIMD